MVSEDGPQEAVLVAVQLELTNDTVEGVIERGGDRIEVLVRELLDRRCCAPVDAEDLRVDPQQRLDVPVLVGDLGGEEKLDVVVRRCEKKRSEQGRNVVLRLEAVREDPEKGVLLGCIQVRECRRIDREVDIERRPLMALPMLVERGERARPLGQSLVSCLVDALDPLLRMPG